ncbi:hypothetical protein ACLFMI_21680 [Pseudonocardia nantongensis]|uniref:hypothetical protein n=1 Tax=Pseudonocardia nantongensis TaxID=1181885 RepID=UPI00397BEC60
MTRRGYRQGHGWGHGHGTPGPDPRSARYAYRAARHDHRRARRLHRRGGGPGRPLLLVLAGLLGVLLLAGATAAVVLYVLVRVLPFLLLAVGALVWVRARHRRAAPQPPGATAPGPTAAETAESAWRRARADFQRVRADFAAHETDPMAVLRRPALSDVAVPSTARFVDAFAAAQALDTDGYPGEPYGASYVRSVEVARRAWQAAVEAADRIRLTGLDLEERHTVERVLKLLTTARDSDSEPERVAAYARARAEMDRLDRSGVVHLPKPARAHLDAAARGALPGGPA